MQAKKNHTGTLLPLIVMVRLFLMPAFSHAKVEAPTEALVTIFVHGIMSIKPHVSINNFIRFLEDDVQNTIYSKSIEYMRQDEFFYRNQAMQQIGLVPIDSTRVEAGYSSGALAHIFEILQKPLPHQQQEKHYYYTYGWSGLLSATSRYQDAKAFFQQLEKLDQEFKSRNIIPKFRIVAYSHGGNVALNLACIRRLEFPSSTLKIHELVMIGTPVQPMTDFLIYDDIFERIYHIFSLKDRVQQIDFISSQCLFSDYLFRPQKGLQLPKKLVQIEVQVKRVAGHVCKNSRKMAAATNLDCRPVALGTSNLLRDASPGHAELWFFGWTPMHYRPSFPFYPLPIIAFLPNIIHEVDSMANTIKPECPIILDFRPETMTMIARLSNQFPPCRVVKLMSLQKYQELLTLLQQYEPDEYSAFAYDYHIKKAVCKAKKFYTTHEESKRKEYMRRGNKRVILPKKHSYLREISLDIY